MQNKWMINMNKFMKTLALLLIMSFLSAQDCVDDATGAFTGMGWSCDMVINTFGMTCDDVFAGTNVAGMIGDIIVIGKRIGIMQHKPIQVNVFKSLGSMKGLLVGRWICNMHLRVRLIRTVNGLILE